MFQNGAGELHESVGSAKRQEAALILWAGAQQMQARLAAVSRCFDFESFHRHSFAAMSFDADPCGWTDPALPVEFIQRHGSRSGLIGRVHHQKIKRDRKSTRLNSSH